MNFYGPVRLHRAAQPVEYLTEEEGKELFNFIFPGVAEQLTEKQPEPEQCETEDSTDYFEEYIQEHCTSDYF